jgi:hypothetical protein
MISVGDYWVNPQQIKYIRQVGTEVWIHFDCNHFIRFRGFVEDVVAAVEKWFAPEDSL